jgi:site-specific DNA-methyltransferase (adenine-specific)
MKAYYKNDLTTIYQGDCLEVMDYLIEQGVKVDAIITDPPYEVITGGKTEQNKNMGILSKQDNYGFKPLPIEKWIYKLYELLKEDTHIYIMTNVLNLENYMKYIKKAEFKIHNILIWDKQNATPNRWYMKNCEYIIFARKGKAKAINDKSSKTILRYSNQNQKMFHPNSKPIELIKRLIENSVKENEIVLDPFSGGFSTCVGAEQLNRRSIGIELEQKYCDVGVKRLSQLQMRLEI